MVDFDFKPVPADRCIPDGYVLLACTHEYNYDRYYFFVGISLNGYLNFAAGDHHYPKTIGYPAGTYYLQYYSEIPVGW